LSPAGDVIPLIGSPAAESRRKLNNCRETSYHEGLAMMRRPSRAGLILVGLLVVLTGRIAIFPSAIRLRASDTNRDGRPDLWQSYDLHGALVHVSVDSNHDGRSDVQESYDNGRLVRRESDRNFDDQIDLIDEFDAATGAHTRSVVDANFDGRADLLVLFADGKPVFSAWVDPGRDTTVAVVAPALRRERHADDPLLALDDPFSSRERLRPDSHRLAAAGACGVVRSLPAALFALIVSPHAVRNPAPLLAALGSFSIPSATPRGPPLPAVPL
jgi:hypothetical protein